ncbi:MAG: hypothetical protein QMD11_02940, partial [Smithella sp.]|nr:hypothetical protein [Smithella sp.]
MNNMKADKVTIKKIAIGRYASYLPRFFVSAFGVIGLVVCAFADGREPILINEAVDDGLIRIVQSRSAGGYSRFM